MSSLPLEAGEDFSFCFLIFSFNLANPPETQDKSPVNYMKESNQGHLLILVNVTLTSWSLRANEAICA